MSLRVSPYGDEPYLCPGFVLGFLQMVANLLLKIGV